MRRGNNGEIRRLEDGRIESVNLGADFCAEHEWGIKDIETAFALDPRKKPGVERRRVRAIPHRLQVSHVTKSKDGPERWAIWYAPYGEYNSRELYLSRENWEDPQSPWREFVGAWSEQDFAVLFTKEQDALDLLDAFNRKDVAFLSANTFGNPFARSGLVLAIVSRLPKEIVSSLEQMAKDADALHKAAEKTGIKKRLDEFSKRGSMSFNRQFGYYALSPRWKDDSKKEVVFWLNPYQQDKFNAGWFGVKDLDDWMKGTGPVVK